MQIITTERENGTKRVRIKLDPESKVEQNHRERVNINSIVAKYKRTGLFPQRNDRPRYGDFTGLTDFHEAQTRIVAAEQDFLLLPAEIRNRFGNDPGQLIQFINDPENEAEARRIGLLPKLPAEPAGPEITPLEATPASETPVPEPSQ